MNASRADTRLTAGFVYEWLCDRADPTIPSCKDIGLAIANHMPWVPDAKRIYEAMLWLQREKMIAFRTSAKTDRPRGHMAIRLTQRDKSFKTDGCPFEAT